MVISKERAQEIRQELIALTDNPDSGDARARYKALRREFLIKNECIKKEGESLCYPDSNNNDTVGIGFNMDAEGAREAWNRAFASSKNKPDFDEVKAKRRHLTQDEIDTLFEHSINEREQQLIKNYGKETWSRLSYNERLAIEDLNYNGGGGLVGSKTKFFSNIQQYVQTGDQQHLDNALWEVSKNSNAAKRRGKADAQGIQNRRDVQAIMLNTYDVDVESIPEPDYRRKVGTVLGDHLKEALAAVAPIKGTVSQENENTSVSLNIPFLLGRGDKGVS